jgi:hypothetical protein
MPGSLSTSDYNPVFLAICDPAVDEIKPTFIYSEVNWEFYQNYLINNKYPLLSRKLIKE